MPSEKLSLVSQASVTSVKLSPGRSKESSTKKETEVTWPEVVKPTFKMEDFWEELPKKMEHLIQTLLECSFLDNLANVKKV